MEHPEELSRKIHKTISDHFKSRKNSSIEFYEALTALEFVKVVLSASFYALLAEKDKENIVKVQHTTSQGQH